MALCHSQVTLMLSTDINIQKPHIPASFNMNLVISKCVTAVKVSNFTGHYLPNRSTLDIGVLGFFGIVSYKEHPPEVWSVPPVTPCIKKACMILYQRHNLIPLMCLVKRQYKNIICGTVIIYVKHL